MNQAGEQKDNEGIELPGIVHSRLSKPGDVGRGLGFSLEATAPGAPALSSLPQDMRDVADQHVHSFVDTLQPSPNFLLLNKGEGLVAGLRRLDNELLTDFNGNTGLFSRYTILQGEVGCCTKYGRTHFLPPGNYRRIGIGTKLHMRQKEDGGEGRPSFVWKDITYVSLPENHVAVVQERDQQLVLGAGRYILRHPTTLYGTVNVQDLTTSCHVTAITEQAVDGKEIEVETKLKSGEWQRAGAITFARAQPGFAYVVQDSQGRLRTGIGFCVCRGGEVFKLFVDMQHYARTTRKFVMESADHHVVHLRVQLRWRLREATLWIMRKGASKDIFDAIEEISQAMLRDSIAGQTYEECRQQAKQGFEGIERDVMPKLEEETSTLGGELLGFEIRELRFPLLDRRHGELADQEAKHKELLFQEKTRMQMQEQVNLRSDAQRHHEMRQLEMEADHRSSLQKITAKEDLEKQENEARLAKASLESKELLRLQQLQADKAAQAVQLQAMEEKAKAEAQYHVIEQKAEADKRLMAAKAEAESVLVKAQAEATARIKLAEADAQAAKLLGAAFKENPQYAELELSKLNASILTARAQALSTALQNNPAVMMPTELQRELAFLSQGFSPIANVLMGGGGPQVLVPQKK